MPPYHYENPVTGASAARAPPPRCRSVARTVGPRSVAARSARCRREPAGELRLLLRQEPVGLTSPTCSPTMRRTKSAQRGVYKGRKRIRAALDLIGPAGAQPGVLNNELQLQPLIHVVGGRQDRESALAHAGNERRARQVRRRGAKASTRTNTRSRTACGRSASSTTTSRSARDYDKGWSKGPLPIDKASEHAAAGCTADGSVRLAARGVSAAVPLRESRSRILSRARTWARRRPTSRRSQRKSAC